MNKLVSRLGFEVTWVILHFAGLSLYKVRVKKIILDFKQNRRRSAPLFFFFIYKAWLC